MYMTIVPSVHTRKQAFDTIHRQKYHGMHIYVYFCTQEITYYKR